MPIRFGPMELGVLLLIIMIVFGLGKLPQVGGAAGKAIREFRREKTSPSEGAEALPSGGTCQQKAQVTKSTPPPAPPAP